LDNPKYSLSRRPLPLGAARAAYQTVLVNSPPEEEKQRLLNLLREIQEIENGLLGL
jgi:hypothetical protein